jgi:hypothetical protein
MSYPFEQYLLRLKDKHQCINPIDNLLFLYDVAQLYDSDEFRTAQFKADLQNFLGLDVPLQDDFEDTGSASYPKGKLKRMDICDAQYDELRKELIKVGARASMRIRKYFLQSPQVVVSNRLHFDAILKEWKVDPC